MRRVEQGTCDLFNRLFGLVKIDRSHVENGSVSRPNNQLFLACNKEFRFLPALASKDMTVEICVATIRLCSVQSHLFTAARAYWCLKGRRFNSGILRQDAPPCCCQAGARKHSHTGSLWS